ncbi:hypothetical protein F511_40364 [Dorcoceras hygrometricum]|uniref:Uncharacterized protein n=1 Tax=Dorcoceras hygrometricum TaxID=472368 RepID=A0A2Z7CS90_9LAMI|nr:hypothetical protein F511_40364 [Dorcoceras hygrometricum]
MAHDVQQRPPSFARNRSTSTLPTAQRLARGTARASATMRNRCTRSTKVNSTVATCWYLCRWERIAAAGSRRANTRFNKEAPRVGYCYARGNQQREFFVNLLVYSRGNQQREFLTHLLVYAPAGLLVCRLFDDVGATLSF